MPEQIARRFKRESPNRAVWEVDVRAAKAWSLEIDATRPPIASAIFARRARLVLWSLALLVFPPFAPRRYAVFGASRLTHARGAAQMPRVDDGRIFGFTRVIAKRSSCWLSAMASAGSGRRYTENRGFPPSGLGTIAQP